LPLSVGKKGLAIDISGTNMIYSGWKSPGPTDYAIYYPLTASSGTSVYNAVSKAYDGTLTNGATISTANYIIPPASLSLTAASNQYLVLPSFTNTGSQLSMSIWYNQTALPASGVYPYLINFGNTGLYIAVYMNAQSNILTCYVNSGNVQNVYTGSLNTWTHFAWVINGASWTVYINGVATTYSNASTLSSTPTARQLILGTTPNSNQCFNGYLQDFRVYNRLLTAAEVTALYNFRG
jgi:hypothetical protein